MAFTRRRMSRVFFAKRYRWELGRLFRRLVMPRPNAFADFLDLGQEIPEIFDIFFDAVVSLGVLVGE